MIPAGPETDEDLMGRLQAGEDSALHSLMGRWEVPVRRFLFRFLPNEAQSLDLAQEVFVKVYQNRHRFSAQMPFRSWMFTIAANLARNQTRWHRRHPTESLDGDRGSDWANTPAQRDDSTPADLLLSAERAEAVRAAIAELPPDLKTAVLLSEYEHLPQAEIGRVLDCSPKAVETRLYRARQALKKSLARFLTETPRV
jgi:RNA polymerase sigma-70 factor (ECF subfamily)